MKLIFQSIGFVLNFLFKVFFRGNMFPIKFDAYFILKIYIELHRCLIISSNTSKERYFLHPV